MTVTFPQLGKQGRLGNQAFQIASTLGIAAKNGDTASFPPWDYAPYFMVPDDLFDNQPGQDASTLARHIDPRARVYLQDYNLFADIADTIRAYFAPSALALEILSAYEVDPDSVALHVRRGDTVPGVDIAAEYHPLTSMDYYRRAVALYPDRPITVFSDDIEWCEKHLPDELDRELTFVTNGYARPKEQNPAYSTSAAMDWVDLQLSARCRGGHVLANSTFGWWAAFLAHDDEATYPGTWFNSSLLGYIDWRLMMLPGWREVAC